MKERIPSSVVVVEKKYTRDVVLVPSMMRAVKYRNDLPRSLDQKWGYLANDAETARVDAEVIGGKEQEEVNINKPNNGMRLFVSNRYHKVQVPQQLPQIADVACTYSLK
jgi:hypothetical protein